MKIIRDTRGFTLIEVMVAIAVLTIGIFSLYSMQTTAISGNSTANGITVASTWAGDRVERLLAMDYDDPLLKDTKAPAGIAGLNSKTDATADGKDVSPDGQYTAYWYVADFLTPDPYNLTASTVKAVRVIVLRQDHGVQKEVVLNYYKQKKF